PTPSDDVNCLYAEERYLFYCSSRSFQLKRSELTGLSSSHTDGKRKESVVEADRGLAQIAVDKQVRVAGERPPQLQRQLRILGFEFVQRLGSEDHEFDGTHGLLSRLLPVIAAQGQFSEGHSGAECVESHAVPVGIRDDGVHLAGDDEVNPAEPLSHATDD